MRRLLSRNAKIALGALPVIVSGCALGVQGDPPEPVLNPTAGTGGETTGGSSATGGAMSTGGATSTGGSSTGGTTGTGGSSTGGADTGGSSTGGSTTGGSTTGGSMTGGGGGSPSTGGSAGKGGTAGAMTGGSAGKGTGGTMTGGTGGSAGKGTGGTMTGGTGGGAAGGPPSGMELFRDNFEMGTSNWTPTPAGSWAIATDGSMVYAATGASANSTWRAAAAGQTTWTDVQIDARVKITSFPGSSTSYYAGVCARYTSNSSYACFALRSDGKIAFRVNGSNTNSVDPPGGAIAPGTWYTVRVVARGANITAFLNGTEVPSNVRVTSGAPASGRLALAVPGANAVFDDIVVSTP